MRYIVVSNEKIHYSCEDGIKKTTSLTITICHHSTSLVMAIGDPRDGFFYRILSLIIDSYIIGRITNYPQKAWNKNSLKVSSSVLSYLFCYTMQYDV